MEFFFMGRRMLSELSVSDDTEALDTKVVGELGAIQGLTIHLHNPDDPEPCQPAADDMDDPRLTSKCKRLRREARGW